MLETSGDRHFSLLNEAQKKAVLQTDGPLLILAGAGTGKTRVLTSRVAHILASGLAYPSQILSVTFTNKAAREMKERIQGAINENIDGLWLGTFHSICVRMLRQHAEVVGLKRDFIILDTDDQIRLLKQIMVENHVDFRKFAPAMIMSQIQKWKDKALSPSDVSGQFFSPQFADAKTPLLYKLYQERLLRQNACDFGDLLSYVVKIFRAYPEVLKSYQDKFKYILVDEYQDTNAIQYIWLSLLAKKSDGSTPNIACVGDDDQSIYSWRGAEIENILRFQKEFPEASVVRLEANYRSTPTILGAASALISSNEGRLGKTLYAAGPAAHSDGEKIKILEFYDSSDESNTIAELAKEEKQLGTPYNDMAILVRAGFQTRALEDSMLRYHIPYQIIGGMKFYERAEIRDAVAYLRSLHSLSDDLAFERIINLPKRGIGSKTIDNLREAGREQGVSLQQSVILALNNKAVTGKASENLKSLMDTFEEVRKIPSEGNLSEVCERLLEETGYIRMLRDDTTPEAPGRLENLYELIRALTEFESIEAFLEHISLTLDLEESPNRDEKISIMTLHAAKGLEFDCVFLPGWEEGLFPSGRSLDEGGTKALEEERRLAYVGLTRARKKAIISHASRRRVYANWQDCIPSRFLKEIPKEFCSFIKKKSAFSYTPKKSFFKQETTDFNQDIDYDTRPRPTQNMSKLRAYIKANREVDNDEQFSRPSSFSIGERVKHSRFGAGLIISADGDRVEVNFDDGETRRLLAEYLRPE